MPFGYAVIMKIEELQVHKATENLGARQRLDHVVREIDFLQVRECLQVHHILHMQSVSLQIGNVKLDAKR